MGFSFKVAPGVRIRASNRGLRASVGPRVARVHVGAGRTSVSSGLGPVSLYHTVGKGRGRQSSGPTRTSIAAYERQLRQAAKLQQASELADAFQAIMNVHREEFSAVTPPVAPPPPPVDQDEIRKRHEQEALRGIGVLHHAARAAARQQAAEKSAAEIAAATAWYEEQRAHLQADLDQQWRQLLANDPDIVFATLTEAFDDNEAPAAVASVDSGEVSVVVLVPGIDAIPERMPERTPAGNLSLKKLTKGVRNSFYAALVCGNVLVTVREATAVAPSITCIRVAVIRRSPPDAYGKRSAECLLAARFGRTALEGVQWQTASAAHIVNDASSELQIRQVASGELRPLDLGQEHALAEMLQAIDLEELGDGPEPLPHSDAPTSA
jgi:hypothetical protein